MTLGGIAYLDLVFWMPFSHALEIDHIDLLCDELVDFSEHRTEDLVESASKQYSQPDGSLKLRNHVRTLPA